MIRQRLSLTAPYLGGGAFSGSRWLLGATLSAAAGLYTRPAWGCAACYGQSDSPMAAGMNWGILSLLGMIVLVLGGVAGFFVFLARRSAAFAAVQADSAVDTGRVVGASVKPGETPAWPAATLAARGALKRVSTLAHPRHRCAENGITAPRQRS
jgi:hypothetical protein